MRAEALFPNRLRACLQLSTISNGYTLFDNIVSRT